jgi:hypothetical protein
VLAKKIVGNDKRGNPIALFEMPADSVKELIVGLHSSEFLKQKVIEWQKRYPHVEIYKSIISRESYSMDRMKLE